MLQLYGVFFQKTYSLGCQVEASNSCQYLKRRIHANLDMVEFLIYQPRLFPNFSMTTVGVFSSAQNSRSMVLSCSLTIGKQLATRRLKLDMSGEGIFSSTERECQVSLQRNTKSRFQSTKRQTCAQLRTSGDLNTDYLNTGNMAIDSCSVSLM